MTHAIVRQADLHQAALFSPSHTATTYSTGIHYGSRARTSGPRRIHNPLMPGYKKKYENLQLTVNI